MFMQRNFHQNLQTTDEPPSKIHHDYQMCICLIDWTWSNLRISEQQCCTSNKDRQRQWIKQRHIGWSWCNWGISKRFRWKWRDMIDIQFGNLPGLCVLNTVKHNATCISCDSTKYTPNKLELLVYCILEIFLRDWSYWGIYRFFGFQTKCWFLNSRRLIFFIQRYSERSQRREKGNCHWFLLNPTRCQTCGMPQDLFNNNNNKNT